MYIKVHKSPLQSPVTTSEIKVASIVEKLNKIITRKSLVTKFPRSTFTRKYNWQKVRGEVDKFQNMKQYSSKNSMWQVCQNTEDIKESNELKSGKGGSVFRKESLLNKDKE